MVKNTQRNSVPKQDLKSFKIYGIYILNNEGKEISHRDILLTSELDRKICKSIVNSIKVFIKNSKRDSSHTYGKLRKIEYGGYKILVEEAKEFLMVVIGRGDFTEFIRENMKKIVENIEGKYSDIILNSGANMETIEIINKEFEILYNLNRSK